MSDEENEREANDRENDRLIDEQLKETAKRNFDAMGESAVFLSLFSAEMHKDPLCLMQLGLAVLLDKPIALMVPEGTKVPGNLKKLAEKIEYFKRDELDTRSLQAATERLGTWMAWRGKQK